MNSMLGRSGAGSPTVATTRCSPAGRGATTTSPAGEKYKMASLRGTPPVRRTSGEGERFRVGAAGKADPGLFPDGAVHSVGAHQVGGAVMAAVREGDGDPAVVMLEFGQ